VIDAFVVRLDVAGLGFERAEAAETGRPGYDPRDLLKLYLYGYLQRIRSSRRLESECQRNVELMWLLGRLCPDHKGIAEFRRVHSDAVTEAGAELIRFARSVGLPSNTSQRPLRACPSVHFSENIGTPSRYPSGQRDAGGMENGWYHPARRGLPGS